MEADNRRDYEVVVQLMYDRAFTLTLTGPSTRLEETESLLQRCWTLRQHTSAPLQARIAALAASLCIKQHNHVEAHQWLDTGESLLRESGLEQIEMARERASLLFDRGENWLVMKEYAQAQIVFEEMLEEAKICGWQRSMVHAQNWYQFPIHLAVSQGRTDVVRVLLEAGAEPGQSRYMYDGWGELLEQAEESGNRDIHHLLVNTLVERYGYAPEFSRLVEVLKSRNTAAARALLESSPELAAASDCYGNGSLHWAALTRLPELVPLLVKKKARLDRLRSKR